MGGCLSDGRYLLLVQTDGVLTQPWPLLATFEAARHRIPIICVAVDVRARHCRLEPPTLPRASRGSDGSEMDLRLDRAWSRAAATSSTWRRTTCLIWRNASAAPRAIRRATIHVTSRAGPVRVCHQPCHQSRATSP